MGDPAPRAGRRSRLLIGLGAAVLAAAAVAAVVGFRHERPAGDAFVGPIRGEVPASDSPSAVEARRVATSAADAVVRAIDDRAVHAFARLSRVGFGVPVGAPAQDSRSIDAEMEPQVEYLHLRYGGRPHRFGAVASTGSPPVFSVPVLFGDAEDLLTLDFDAHYRLLTIHEDDPASFVDPDAPRAPPK